MNKLIDFDEFVVTPHLVLSRFKMNLLGPLNNMMYLMVYLGLFIRLGQLIKTNPICTIGFDWIGLVNWFMFLLLTHC